MRKVNVKVKNSIALVIITILTISVAVQPGLAQEIEALSDNKKRVVEPSETTGQAEIITTPLPEETTTSDTNNWLLYGGVTAVGVGILALAIGSSDSGSSSSSTVDSGVDPVGPSIAGSDWLGTLNITQVGDEGNQGVSAVITQSGESITITTSSSLSYGQYYFGHTSASGYITVKDSTTNKIWTTHRGNASTNSIHLYDYVNDETSFDTLFLVR